MGKLLTTTGLVIASFILPSRVHSQQACVQAPPGLITWWRAETNGLDWVGVNNVVSPAGYYTSGEVGQAFGCNGTNVDFRVPASRTLDVGAGGGLTIEMWINPVDASLQQNLIEWNNGAGFIGTHMTLSVPYANGGTASLWANLVDTAGAPHQLTSDSGLVASGVFQHVALTYDKASGV